MFFFPVFFHVLLQLLLYFSQLGVYNCHILMKSVGVECISAKSTMALIFSLRQSKREGKRQREREVTLLHEWQWPSCIASLKWGWGGGECHFQVSPQHSSLMRDGFCSTDSQGDQERALPASSSSLSSTSQISNPLRSWQLGDRRACVSSTCTTSFPNHNNNNKGREVSASWHSPVLVMRTSPYTSVLMKRSHTYVLTAYWLVSTHFFPSVRDTREYYLASQASDSSIPAEGKGDRRDLPGLLAAPICQMHPAHWFTFTARIYGMPAAKRVEAARIMG